MSSEKPPLASAAPSPSASLAKDVSAPSGFVSALEHTGIPRSWLTKRPKLPSRNWLIFWGVVSSTVALYVDDRRKCKAIRQEYIDKVKHLAEVPLGSADLPRKIRVFACRWPGDEEYQRSMKYFKMYVKPILVAAAIDYDTKNGNVHGAISKLVESRAKDQRLEQLGLTPPPAPGTSWPPKSEIAIRREKEREMEGGTILIGRHTFKEYMHGLKRGWTVPITVDKVDEEEALAMALADDGVFDERDTPPGVSEFGGDDDIPTHSDSGNPAQTGVTAGPPRSTLFSPLQTLRAPPGLTARNPSSSSSPTSPTHSPNPALTTPPATIPAQPPLLLVSFPNRLGFLNVPLMIVDFFNERRNVRNGCEAAYKLVLAYTRDIRGATSSGEPTDLDFAIDTEKNYRSSYNDTPKVVSKARESYYTELGDKIALARTLAREEREPTKDEVAYPPKTEVELRAQRLAKEKKWREEEEAFTFVKAGEGAQWDERFEGGVLRVFREPSMEEEREFEEGRSGRFQ